MGDALQILLLQLDYNETKEIWCKAHWEELLQSVSDFIFNKHCGCTPRGVRGVKRPEILWEIQKYSLPGRPSSQNGVKSKTICHFLRNFDEFLNGFWFYSILAGWSTWQWVFLNFSQNFWSFDTPDTHGCVSAVIAENEIWNRIKQFLPVWDGKLDTGIYIILCLHLWIPDIDTYSCLS